MSGLTASAPSCRGDGRALAIVVFYSLGTAACGILAPCFFGVLIGTGSRESVSVGYAVGVALMLFAAAVEWRIGVNAEKLSLERIASPLSAQGATRNQHIIEHEGHRP
jgi:hypothetical protein